MFKEIKTVGGPVNARIRVPGSKSISNRALVCAALAQGESGILNASDSDDTALMANGLNQLGVLVRRQGDDTLVVHGTGGKLYAPKFPIPVGNAGTTLRFLISLAALAEGKVVLEGVERMSQRPINELLDALSAWGAKSRSHAGSARYEIEGGGLKGGVTNVRGDKSSQFLSSLLMISPYTKSDAVIQVDGEIASSSYVQMTLGVVKSFGVAVAFEGGKQFTIEAGQRYRPCEFRVEHDASSATYFFAAAAIMGGKVVVEGIRTHSAQPDIGFLRIIEGMGCRITETAEGVQVESSGELNGVMVDMNSMPDSVPTLAVIALFGRGTTRIRNIGHLRYKESDRLEALVAELSKLGANIRIVDDGLEITPAPLKGALLDTYDDHRLAMSFALVGLRVPGVRIENPDCVRKSFPGFWNELEALHYVTPA